MWEINGTVVFRVSDSGKTGGALKGREIRNMYKESEMNQQSYSAVLFDLESRCTVEGIASHCRMRVL